MLFWDSFGKKPETPYPFTLAAQFHPQLRACNINNVGCLFRVPTSTCQLLVHLWSMANVLALHRPDFRPTDESSTLKNLARVNVEKQFQISKGLIHTNRHRRRISDPDGLRRIFSRRCRGEQTTGPLRLRPGQALDLVIFRSERSRGARDDRGSGDIGSRCIDPSTLETHSGANRSPALRMTRHVIWARAGRFRRA